MNAEARDSQRLPDHEVKGIRLTAGVFAVLFGALGIHKFILGRPITGLITLLVSVLSLGKLAPLTALLGIIEGFLYISLSNDAFRRHYIDGDRRWF